MVQGTAEVIRAPDEVLPLVREMARQRGTPEERLPSEAPASAAFIRLKPEKFISGPFLKRVR